MPINSFWQFIGPINLIPANPNPGMSPVSGRINAVAFHPRNDGEWYAGAPSGGVWKTIDRGTTWRPITDTPDWPVVASISSMAFDATGQNLYLGTGDVPMGLGFAVGVMKTADGGVTWKNVSDSRFAGSIISRVVVHPDQSNVVLAAEFGGGGGIWRSTDFGKSWNVVIPVQVPIAWTGMEFGARDPNTGQRSCYAVGESGNFLRSDDDGRGWTPLSTPLSAKSKKPQIATSPIFPGLARLGCPLTP